MQNKVMATKINEYSRKALTLGFKIYALLLPLLIIVRFDERRALTSDSICSAVRTMIADCFSSEEYQTHAKAVASFVESRILAHEGEGEGSNIAIAINTPTTMNNQFEALNAPKIDLHSLFLTCYEPFKHTILGGLLSFEILGGWRRLCVLRKRLTRKSSSQTTYLKVVQDKQSRPDLFPRFWSNLAYLGRLSRTSSTWMTFKDKYTVTTLRNIYSSNQTNIMYKLSPYHMHTRRNKYGPRRSTAKRNVGRTSSILTQENPLRCWNKKRTSDVVTARSPGVPPELSKGRYGHVSTHLDNPTCPVIGPRVDGRITFFEIPSHPHPYTSTYSHAHRDMEMEE
ncbi:hypothetical protein YC2023_033372 [Brassica napus]